MAGEQSDDGDNTGPAFRPLRRAAADFDVDASTDAMSDIFEIALETVRQLEKDGHFEKNARGRFAFLPSLRNYVAHLRDLASGRGGGEDQANQARENALLARAKRENLDLKNAQLRGELVDASRVAAAFASDWLKVRTALLTVPSRLATQMPHLDRADVNKIDKLIRTTLLSVSQEISGDGGSAGDNSSAGSGEAGAAAD